MCDETSICDLRQRAATYYEQAIQEHQARHPPVEHPTTFKPIINLTTAKALG
jgi:hypothetical protein